MTPEKYENNMLACLLFLYQCGRVNQNKCPLEIVLLLPSYLRVAGNSLMSGPEAYKAG